MGAILAIAAVGVYLLAIAAVGFVGWLVRVATKKTPAAEVPPAPQPPPPRSLYSVVVPVEAAAFETRDSAQLAARRCFGAWAAQLPKAPRDPRDAVVDVRVRMKMIGRLVTVLDGRRVVWRAQPKAGRAVVTRAPVSPEQFDPWNPPADLRSRSYYVASCWTCGGDGKVSCVACAGAGRQTCRACDGACKTYGYTSNGQRRLLNCKECRGKGSVVCDGCRRGNVECSTCQAFKRLECWLEVDESRRIDVQIEPDGAMTKAFEWGQDGVLATDDQVRRDARVMHALELGRAVTPSDLRGQVDETWVAENWSAIQPTVNAGERIRSQTFQLLEVPETAVEYAVGNVRQQVVFEGLRMLAPAVDADQAFAARASTLTRLAWVLAALPIGALILYASRGEYFFTERTGPLVAGIVACAAFAAICAYGVFWSASLGRRKGRGWIIASLPAVAGACVLAVVAEPSVARADDLIAAGLLDQARFELDALGPRTEPELAARWNEVDLREALAATTCTLANASTARMTAGSEARARAQAHADQLALKAAGVAYAQRKLDDAVAQLRCASEQARSGKEGRSLLSSIEIARASQCLEAEDWACVFAATGTARTHGGAEEAEKLSSTAATAIRARVDRDVKAAKVEKDLSRRVLLQRDALDLWTRYLTLEAGGDKTALAALQATQAADERALSRVEEVAAQRRAAEEKREAERAAAQERRRLAAEQREERRREAAEERASQQLRLEPQRSCCKYCSSGCPCGDSCISCSKTCRVGRGCAC